LIGVCRFTLAGLNAILENMYINNGANQAVTQRKCVTAARTPSDITNKNRIKFLFFFVGDIFEIC
jgi:hypothetical protein